MEKSNIECGGGFYLENFIETKNVRNRLHNVALYDIDYTRFFGIYNKKDELIGEICNINFGIVLALHGRESLKPLDLRRILIAFCDFLFMKHGVKMISFHQNLNNFDLDECKKLGFVCTPEARFASKGEYSVTKKEFYEALNTDLTTKTRARTITQSMDISKSSGLPEFPHLFSKSPDSSFESPSSFSELPSQKISLSFIEKILKYFRLISA